MSLRRSLFGGTGVARPEEGGGDGDFGSLWMECFDVREGSAGGSFDTFLEKGLAARPT